MREITKFPPIVGMKRAKMLWTSSSFSFQQFLVVIKFLKNSVKPTLKTPEKILQFWIATTKKIMLKSFLFPFCYTKIVGKVQSTSKDDSVPSLPSETLENLRISTLLSSAYISNMEGRGLFEAVRFFNVHLPSVRAECPDSEFDFFINKLQQIFGRMPLP